MLVPSVGKSDRAAREDVVLAQAAWMKSRRSLRCDVVLDVLAVKAATCGAYNARGSAPPKAGEIDLWQS